MSTFLLPCPFCGELPGILVPNAADDLYMVACTSRRCRVQPQVGDYDERSAWILWNRRTPESAVQGRRCTHCTQQPATTIDEYSDPVCLKCKTEDK
jgi:hypothetical protein